MKCADFESRLHALLDERRSPDADPALAEHQQGCLACRRMTEALLTAIDAIRQMPRPEPAESFSQRVLEDVVAGADPTPSGALVAASRRRSTPVAWRSWSAVAAAAAVVVLALLAWQRPVDNGREVADRTADDPAAQTTEERADKTPDATDPADIVHGDIRPDGAEQPADRAPAEVADPGEVFLALVGLSPVTGAGRRTSVPAAGASNGLDNPMTEGLRQVGDSTAGALGRLLDAFPVPEGPSS